MKSRLFFIVVFSVIILGCSSGGYYDYDPYVGSGGVEIYFIDGAPPYEILENEQLPIGLRIVNEGAYDVNRGKLSIVVEEDYMGKPGGDYFDILLLGRSKLNPEGEETTKMFYSDVKSLEQQSQIHKSQMIVSACYEYKTKLNTNVCIDPDIFNTKKDPKPCEVEELSFSGQGAPVGVTRVKETITKNEYGSLTPSFEMTIENLGNGDAVDYIRTMNFCDSEPVYREYYNRIDIDANVAGVELECNPNPVILSEYGDAVTRCKVVNSIQSPTTAYTSLLEVNLMYGYTFSLTKEVVIEKASTR